MALLVFLFLALCPLFSNTPKAMTDALGTDSSETLDSASIPTIETSVNRIIELLFITLSESTGEPVPSVNFYLSNYGGVSSDSDGIAEVHLPIMDSTKTDSIRVSLQDSVWELKQAVFPIPRDRELAQFNILLKKRKQDTPKKQSKEADIVVIAKREPLHERKEVSLKTVNREEMQEVSSTLGDPLRVVSTLPGVSNTSDLNVRPYVRGGDEKETRHFWNNIPLIQPYHALSAFSIYNMETVKDLKFYSGAFPVEGNGSLSGAMFMTSRPAPLDTVHAMTHLSLLRGNAYVGSPIVKDKFGIYASYQALLYDWVIKRGLDIVKWLSSDTNTEKSINNTAKSINEYQKFTDLPNFKDLEFGFAWKINRQWQLEYSGLRANDLFRVLDSRLIFTDTEGDSTDIIESIKKIDTLALVELPNWIHGVNLRWNVKPNWIMNNTLALQSQDWNVQFNDVSADPLFDLKRRSINSRSHNIFEFSKNQIFTFGLGYDYKFQKYDVNIPRVAYEVLVNGNPDLIESIGLFNPEGFVITQSNILTSVNEYADNLIMDYEGERGQHFGAAYFSDEIKIDSKRKLTMGGRLEYENTSNSFFPAPRISWYQSLDPQTEISFSTGLYSQNDFDFYYRHFNPKLKSEKAWHLNAEWSHDFNPYFGLEWSNYGKYYYDLTAIRLVSTDEVDPDFLFNALDTYTRYTFSNFGPDSLAADLGITTEELKARLNELQAQILAILPEEQARNIRDAIGYRRLDFNNSGIGYALGSELSFKYDPTHTWRGWISGEASLSKRKDGYSDIWYSFRKHRPWNIKWHNFFDFPNKYQLSIKANLSAGQAYTGFTDFRRFDQTQSDTVFVVERRNNRRYNPYTRVDFRLSQTGNLWGHPYTSFFEIWNSFNEPNFLLTDSKTNKFVFFEYNFPIPTIFLGYEFRW